MRRFRFHSTLILFMVTGAFTVAGVRAQEAAGECTYSETIPVVEDYSRLITFADPYRGNFDADVTVIEYFDPNCSHCKALQPIMERIMAENSEDVRFFYVPFVLWEFSLLQIEALFVAGQDGKYFEMLNRQFELQKAGGLNLDELVVIATEIGLDPTVFRTRMEKMLNQRMIVNRRTEIRDLGITGTPAVMINGKVVDPSSRSYACLTQILHQEVAQASGR